MAIAELQADTNCNTTDLKTTIEKANVEFHSDDIIFYHGLRIPIDSYDANIRDQVRRAYLAKGHYQPSAYNFPKTHNEATRHCQAFKNQRQSISHVFSEQGYEIDVEYRKRLTASLDVIRLLLRQGLSLRGHDESPASLNKGKFLEILEWHCSKKDY
ncbi:hypothetical protein OROGR_025340 [Orobanche gracilis]